jgi:hypothetical protein
MPYIANTLVHPETKLQNVVRSGPNHVQNSEVAPKGGLSRGAVDIIHLFPHYNFFVTDVSPIAITLSFFRLT